MSLSPVKQIRLARQRSFPCITVGIAPDLPDNCIAPVTPPLLKRSKSRPRIHRGDVSSSASSACESDSAADSEMDTTPKQIAPGSTPPKRRVIGAIEPMSIGRPKTGKRETLQSRLQAAAALRSSKSMDTLSAIPPVPPLPMFPSSPSSSRVSPKRKYEVAIGSPEKQRSSKSDKVVVCVRVKPTESPFSELAYDITDTSISLSDAHPNVVKRGGKSGREDEYTYTFDKLLHHPSTTSDLYKAKIAPLVDKTMLGFNTTVFAYGATASGKSYTMTGTPSELGIIPCAIDGVFDAINEEVDREYLLRVSYLEIYNETIRDLLNFKPGPLRDEEKPSIHTDKGKVYVQPLAESVVSTPQDVVNLLDKGNRLRKVGVTDWNERSSRSHSVFNIVIESRPRDGHGGDEVRLSRLTLIDLAGSEKAASDADRRGEGKHINQSLLALREVINKLTEKKRSHIPYRNSKLTHLLENNLGGDSNICVICTLSFEEAHHAETLETLKFAGRCSQVETRAKKNILLSDDQALIRAKDQEIQNLKQQLQAIQPIPFTSAEQLSESVAAMEERKTRLAKQLAKLNAEILTSEALPRITTGMLSPLPKRRRISDIHSVGMGTPQKTTHDRRAVSNMVRVVEEAEQPLSVTHLAQSFDNELIAALRKSLAAKEEELTAAKRELSILTASLAELPERRAEVEKLKADLSDLKSKHDAIEKNAVGIRADLNEQILEKSAKIDTLEHAILDLRKSREELIVEDSKQLKIVQDELDSVKTRLAKSAELNDAEQRALRASHLRLEEDAKANESKIHRELVEGLRKLEDSKTESAEALERVRLENEQKLDTLRAGMDATFDQKRAAWEDERSALQTALAEAKQAAVCSQQELERFQRASMESETTAVVELKAQIERAREDALNTEKRLCEETMILKRQLADEREQVAAIKVELDFERASCSTAKTSFGEAQQCWIDEKITLSARAQEQDILIEELRASLHAKDDQLRANAGHAETWSKASTVHQQREAQLTAELDDLKESIRRMEENHAKRLSASEEAKEAAELQARRAVVAAQESEDSLRAITIAQCQSKQESDDVASALKREMDALRAECEESKQRESRLSETLEDLRERETQVRTDVERLKEETSRAISEEECKTKEALALCERHEALLELARSGESQVKAEQQAAQDELRQLKVDIDALRYEYAQCHNNLQTERAKSGQAGAALSQVERELVEVKRHVHTLEAEIESLRQESGSSQDNHDETREAAAERLLDHLRGSDRADRDTTSYHLDDPRDEIDRLGKIVEAQSIIIEEQKAKIKFWARELEQQREIVRALTLNPESPETGFSYRDHTQPGQAPSGGSPLRRVKTVHKKLSSTFTAFNLAMPSAPTPLPMHPSQVDNTTVRKGRRLTIEHDIGLLSDSSKVNKARAVFNKLDETPPRKSAHHERSRSGIPGSIPKQRRP